MAFAAPALLLARGAIGGSAAAARSRSGLAWLLAGLAVSLAGYALWWQMPHRAELYELLDYPAYNHFDSGVFNFTLNPNLPS